MNVVLFLCVWIGSFASFGQDPHSVPIPSVPHSELTPITIESVHIYRCEVDAQYPGGTRALVHYLSEECDWSGLNLNGDLVTNSKVYVSFVVNENGGIEHAQILRGIHPEIDARCLSLVRGMPNWIPATDCNQQPIRQTYTMPIQICLD